MAKTPINKAGRKPTGKKTFDLKKFKEKTGTQTVAEKPTKWIELSPAFQDQLGVPGFPIGYVSGVRGHSNTGKSTAICEAIVAAQKQDIFPIIIDTENNLGLERLEKMGFDVENDFFIKINNSFLLEHFGKPRDKERNLASIEDLGACMNYFLELQKSGELPYDILFAIDSIGTLDCNQTIKALENDTSLNNQWNAGAYEKYLKAIVNYKIPNSRSVESPYTNTVITVQKIWMSPNALGKPSVMHKGGTTWQYAYRLLIHIGGHEVASAGKINAVSKGRKVNFGTETKVAIVKNHIDGKYGGISLEGKLISTPHGFIGSDNDSKNNYKKDNILHFRDVLDEDIDVEDIKTEYAPDSEIELIEESLDDKLKDIKKTDTQKNMDDFENEKN